ncbi:MAG: hypothetical protein ACI97A_003785 [Planctomycetota bacterium]|jgi:hypothetical protein
MVTCIRRSLVHCCAILLFAGVLSIGVQAQSTLSTTLAGGTVTIGSMFEVKALTNVQIDSFDVRFALISVGLPSVVEVWALNSTGSYVGANQTSSANWTQLAAVPVMGAITSPFALNLNLGFMIPAGVVQSFYITLNNSGLRLEDTPGTAAGTLFAGNSDIQFFEGHDGLHFNATMSPQVWNGNIHYTTLATVTDDVSIDSLTMPTSNAIDCGLGTAADSVTVSVRNRGTNSIPIGAVLQVTYQVDAMPPVFEFIVTTAVFNTGDVLLHTFAPTVDMSTPGIRTLVGTVLHAGDLEPSNDTITEQIGSGGELRVTSYPYVENFDLFGGPATTEPPYGFNNSASDASGPNSDWVIRDDPTPSLGVGPAADHTTGVAGTGGFAYCDGDGVYANVALRSPCFDLTGMLNPTATFWVHSDSTASPGFFNTLTMNAVSYPSGTVTTNIIPSIGHLGTGWTRQQINLSAFIGQVVQLVMKVNSTSAGPNHDIAIDDFSVSDLQPTPGQAPQPGLAVLDINGPLNANGEPLQFGFGGPYFKALTAGETMLINIEATPMQVIVLFAGALNPVAATFPGSGTVDIGGPVNPMNGIPSGISVLADGAIPFGLDSFFRTAANGLFDFGITVPIFPPGIKVAFQVAISSSPGIPIKLSNCVEVAF